MGLSTALIIGIVLVAALGLCIIVIAIFFTMRAPRERNPLRSSAHDTHDTSDADMKHQRAAKQGTHGGGVIPFVPFMVAPGDGSAPHARAGGSAHASPYEAAGGNTDWSGTSGALDASSSATDSGGGGTDSGDGGGSSGGGGGD